tara:strand:+ start:1730 stop:3640 length:1911 start_codon:yes stop_codon:yes gene_type:complete
MTVVRPNSIAGINSITVQTGQALNIHDASGNLIRNITSSSGVSTFSSLHVGSGTTTNSQGISVGTGASIGQNTVNELHFFTSGTNHLGINNEGQLTCQGAGSQLNLTKSGSDATEVTASLYTSNSGTHNQVTIKTSTNNGGDPFIKFDGGGSDMIVGERYVGTTNNLLVLGPGQNPDTTSGIFVKGTGFVGVGTDSPGRHLDIKDATGANRIVNVRGTGSSGAFMAFLDANTSDDSKCRVGSIAGNNLGLRGDTVSIQNGAGTNKMVLDGNGNANITGVCTAAAFVPSSGQIGSRNIVINGAMKIAQRGDTSSVQDGYGGCDRFRFVGNTAARATLNQTTGPTDKGFRYCQEVDVTTADASLAAGDYHYLGYRFEGQDLQQLKKGTAGAESVTLSFWVSSPKTGTHIIQLYDNDNARHICKSYTVSSADTWEKKTITFPGDTTGTLGNDNAYSLQIYWYLLAGSNYTSGTLQSSSWDSFTAANTAVGQVNCLDNTSNNFKLTGVQFEVGSYATPFEHVRYDEELTRCKRYFQDWTDWETFANKTSDSTYDGHVVLGMFELNMRANPTVSPNVVYGRQAGESGWTNGDNNEAAAVHHDASSTFPGRWFRLTGTWNWHSGYNDTIAVKFHSVKFDAEL